MKKAIYLLLLLPCLALKCKKDSETLPIVLTEEQKLPAATSEGKNTLGCLVDGKAWLPDNGGTINNPLTKDYWQHQMSIGAAKWGKNPRTDKRELLESLWLSFLYLDKPTSVDMTEQNGYLNFYRDSSSCVYEGPSILSGTLSVTTLDTVREIIAGTFECTLYVDSLCDTIHITQGRFDIQF